MLAGRRVAPSSHPSAAAERHISSSQTESRQKWRSFSLQKRLHFENAIRLDEEGRDTEIRRNVYATSPHNGLHERNTIGIDV